ncbi:DUF3102 domain-containing protein [Ochrobactrum sp. MC-1LL]|uniref:DUF3102 domain-containing protein n=1 Tax=Ochrobactrum sp. MC-1LL TaxID=2735351 RepID=UPI0014385E32|nr:DUF3102 domain-containing protein [Ochrobactrum sp. MC-1LL]NKE74080.1 DUF3102 domain-containing protein [Ochrobactrum sp. MC-1LL]
MTTAHELCAEFDIEIIPGTSYPLPGQTRAVATINRLIEKYGEGHARIVLSTLAEAAGKQGLIDKYSLWAVSDLVRACSDWIETDLSSWYEAWDQMPMGFAMWECNQLSGIVRQRSGLAGMLYLMLSMHKSAKRANKAPNYKALMKAYDEEKALHRATSKEIEGNPDEGPMFQPYTRHTEAELIEIGQYLIQNKQSLPHGEFGPWVRNKTGLSYKTALKAMKLAQAA